MSIALSLSRLTEGRTIFIPDYVNNFVERKKPAGTTPIEVSTQIHNHADKALQILGALSHGGNKELRLTLGDIRAMAYLGKYYAHKIRGATELALFRESKKRGHQNAAIEELTKAAQYWRLYASTALGQYKNPLWTNRVGHCDWRDLFNEVLNDIRTAGGSPGLASMPPTSGGTILEADSRPIMALRRRQIAAGIQERDTSISTVQPTRAGWNGHSMRRKQGPISRRHAMRANRANILLP